MHEIRKMMTAQPQCVAPQTPVDEALALLVEHNITGLPVVDADKHVVGMITEKDLLVLLDREKGGVVGDYMTRDVVTYDVSSDIIAICEALTNKSFRRIPITESGKLIGVISRRDLIRYIIEPIG